MKSCLKFRAYQKSDAPYLETIIRETWQYDSFCSPKTAKRMARVYLAACLTEQTFTKVALWDQEPVGVIMAKNIKKGRKSFHAFWNLMVCAVPLCLSKEGRAAAKLFSGINTLDLALLKKSEKEYDGEIAFFAISENCRGMGIGKSLFDMALEYFKNEKIKSYYLYTDSSCNYGFYEHQEMVRRAEATYEMPFEMNPKMEFYLYDGSLQ